MVIYEIWGFNRGKYEDVKPCSLLENYQLTVSISLYVTPEKRGIFSVTLVKFTPFYLQLDVARGQYGRFALLIYVCAACC